MPLRGRMSIDADDTREMAPQRRGRSICCPNCMRTFESMRRFRLTCPRCGHLWTERSNRNVIDWLQEQPTALAGNLMWLIPAAWVLAFIAAIAYLLSRHVDDSDELIALLPLVALFVLVSAGIVLLGRNREPPYR